MGDFGNFRTPLADNSVIGNNLIRTPFGNVPTSSSIAPVPPPPPNGTQQTMGFHSYSSPMSMGMGNTYFSTPYSGGYGGMMGIGGYGAGGFGFNRYGGNMNSPENMFIQLAEERSRPAFQSIESLVSAVSNIALMLDSTFFAITNTFRAILGVAANFGRLRGLFSQFWQTFAIFRGLSWIYRKILYWMKLTNIDPSSAAFQKAFSAAARGESFSEIKKKSGGTSAWPIITFLGFILTAPFLITKLMGSVHKSALEESRNPLTWINPITAKAEYSFKARNESELTLRVGQTVLVAPKEVQQMHNLLNTGWALATVNRETSGIVPINHVSQVKSQNQNIPSNDEHAGIRAGNLPSSSNSNVESTNTKDI